jgi:hypothetical protein
MAKGVLISFMVMAIGIAWLLNTLNFIGGVDWIWTGLLGASGLIALAWGKLNKFTFIIGAFLVVSSVFSILRQTGIMSVNVEIPLLVIAFGAVLLIAQLPFIPLPKMVLDMKEEAAREKASSK